MKKSIALLVLSLLSQVASAQSLAECEAKIGELLSKVKTQELRVLALNDVTSTDQARVDTYHMSNNTLCGVELLEETGLLTVTKFKPLADVSSAIPFREVVKFESIMLNGSDPTRSNGRIKSKVSCSMTENSIRYVTKVPVLTDGVKSPWAIEELNVSLTGNTLYFHLRASVTPIHKIFRSITDCKLTVE